MKKLIILIAVIIALWLGFSAYTNNNKEILPDNTIPTENIDNTKEKADLIVVETPAPNSVLPNTFEIEGQARGYWFFEASFPVRLVAEDGTVLLNDYIMTDSEWMTEKFVPFKKTFTYENSTGVEKGTLILERDNPSGLPENADSLTIPVRLSSSVDTDTMDVKVYFNKSIIGTESCDDIQSPVTRTISQTSGVARATLLELLKGPTASENLSTSIPEGTTLNKIEVRNDTVYADFNTKLKNPGGSCNALAIRSQIEDTLKQFSTIKSVVISVNGQSEGILEP